MAEPKAQIGKTIADSIPWWQTRVAPRTGAPNILLVLFDDVGFSDFGCYGSPIATPTIDVLAAHGLRYTGFHTTAMCSTTRAALLTGRNHHSVGVGCLANFDSGYPGYRGKIAAEAGTLAELLRTVGYRNYMVGKWHVTSLTETGPTGPFDGWPLGRGFDRFYGFMDAETDQYAPELVRDNTPIDAPGGYAGGYHLTEDLTDQALRYIADHGDRAVGHPSAPMQRLCPAVGRSYGAGASALHPLAGRFCRHAGSRRPPSGAPRFLPRGGGLAREHADSGPLRQWRQPGRRAPGHGERHGAIQWQARADR